MSAPQSCSLRDGKILHYVQDDKKTLFIAMTNRVLGIMQNSQFTVNYYGKYRIIFQIARDKTVGQYISITWEKSTTGPEALPDVGP
jgi:hypothetical protein